MLGNTISLFKARKDPALAKNIASEMVVDGAIDRAGWPILVAKFWMMVAILGLIALIALFIWIGTATHMALAFPVLIFAALIYVILRLWQGLNRGLETVSDLAKTELKKRAAQLKIPKREPAPEKTSEETLEN